MKLLARKFSKNKLVFPEMIKNVKKLQLNLLKLKKYTKLRQIKNLAAIKKGKIKKEKKKIKIKTEKFK
jgi:hypothetical protein